MFGWLKEVFWTDAAPLVVSDIKWPRITKQYLGHSLMVYITKDTKAEHSRVVYFWAWGDNLEHREATFTNLSSWEETYWKNHKFFQEAVVPWTLGEPIWGPISSPSAFFKEWTKEKKGFIFDKAKNWWINPTITKEPGVGSETMAVAVATPDSNVVTFPTKDKNG